MPAVMLQVIPSFCRKFSKNSLFKSGNTYEKNIMSKDYCIARHDDEMCLLPSCRYLILHISEIEELLQKLDAFCFNYQHVHCTVCVHFSSTDSVTKLFSRADNSLILSRGNSCQPPTQRKRQNTEHCERETFGEKVQKNNFWAPSKTLNPCSFQKTRLNVMDQSLQTELNKLRRLSSIENW